MATPDIVTNRLTYVRKATRRNSSNQILSEFVCACGETVFVPASVVRSNNTKSCGCLKRDRATVHLESIRVKAVRGAAKAHTTHGMTGTPLYYVWRGMINRTTNPKVKGFERWGGRGIRVCDRWLDFQKFHDDMYAEYEAHRRLHPGRNTSIERVDNDGNYEPSNCRWATPTEQGLNRRQPPIGRNSRLTPQQVVNIKHCKDSIPSKKLGSLYGISGTTVLDIWSGKTWSRIDEALEAIL